MRQPPARVVGGVLALTVAVGAVALAAGIFDSDGADKLVSRIAPSPSLSPSPLPYINIRGEEVALLPGMTYGQSPAPPRDWLVPIPVAPVWRVTYDPGEGPGRVSWLDFDNKFTLVASQIHREDRELFAPLLSTLDSPLDEFDKPPTQITIRDQPVPLAPGMTYVQRSSLRCGSPCPTTEITTWQVIYDLSPEDALESWITFNQDFNVLNSRILDEDSDLFKPLLDVLKPSYDIFASPPAYIFIRGKPVPLAPGMTYGRVGGTGDGLLEPGATPPPTPSFREVWEVTYDANPAEPGYSKLAFDENYNLLTSSVRPEDQDEFQPLLDAFLDP